MEGSGSVDPNALVERLHLSLASIQAGQHFTEAEKKTGPADVRAAGKAKGK